MVAAVRGGAYKAAAKPRARVQSGAAGKGRPAPSKFHSGAPGLPPRLALGIAGAVTVALAHGSGPRIGTNPQLGDLLSVLTTVWYSGYFLCVRAARAPGGAAAIMFWSSVVGVVVLAGVMLALGEDITPETAMGWGACLGLAVVHACGQGAIAWSLGRLPAATASVVVLVQPVVAVFLGWVLFAEAVGPIHGLGAVVALAGVAIAQWAAARNENGRRSQSEPAPGVSVS